MKKKQPKSKQNDLKTTHCQYTDRVEKELNLPIKDVYQKIMLKQYLK